MDTRASSEVGPSSSGSLTPTRMPSNPPISRNPDEIRTLVLQVYKEVWDEFNKWKPENCQQQLLLLQKPLPPPAVAEDALIESLNLRDGEPGEVEVIYICETEDDIPLNPGGSTVVMCDTVSLELPKLPTGEDFDKHPCYEFCTPAVQSIANRVGSAAEAEVETVPFVPYADDPKFNVKSYLSNYKNFAWEQLVDPDVEVIQLETLRRLRFGHRLSPDEIDDAEVLPLLRTTNRDGLIFKVTQRDDLFWPEIMDNFPIDADGVEERILDPRAHEPDIDDLRGRLDSINPNFCPNPCCIQAFCPQHSSLTPPVPPTAPRVTSDAYPEGEPCGNMCFREIDDTFTEDSVDWAERDVDELQCILDIIPDTLPCGLAILVRKPCREVYVLRRRLILDDRVYPESGPTLSYKERLSIKGYRDEKDESESFDNYLSPGPCSHSGPCDQSNPECSCAEVSVHCSRHCSCGPSCNRRWVGCRCVLTPKKARTQTSVKCDTDKCICKKQGRECDPSVCTCGAKKKELRSSSKKPPPRQTDPDGKYYCRNSDIQRGSGAEIEIKRAEYGLGAFAVKSISEGQFLGEYVGEFVPEEHHAREDLRKHIFLNYNFGYNPKFTLDSARVGNETRYINHGSAKEGKANCVARTKLVFGEQRIGLWTTRRIRKGEEILFDYGINYWTWNDKT